MSNPKPGPGKRFTSNDDRCPRQGKRPGMPKVWEREADSTSAAIIARDNLYDAVIN